MSHTALSYSTPFSCDAAQESSSGAVRLTLADAEAMFGLGRAFGSLLLQAAGETSGHALRSVLLHGPLGAGKTTFTRGFVSALPGNDHAEVSSPSFTLCNMYPTLPPVLHCDLYRSSDLTADGTLRSLPDEVEDALDSDDGFVLVEWAERFPTAARPPDRLDIFFQVCQNERSALLIPYGTAACRMLERFKPETPGGENRA